MAILVAKLMLVKCEQDHAKHTVEKFSYVKRDPLRSCAFCIDYVEGLADWEINLLADTGFKPSDRLLMASNLRNMALAAVR
jgi:hypothetical protein